MSDTPTRFDPPAALAKSAHVNADIYRDLYAQSVKDPDAFWKDMAKRLDWLKEPAVISNCSFDETDFRIRLYEDSILNASYNYDYRHLPDRKNNIGLIWEGDDPDHDKKITYCELKDDVSRLANALKSRGVKRGDRVTI